jgi:hypothetical protein
MPLPTLSGLSGVANCALGENQAVAKLPEKPTWRSRVRGRALQTDWREVYSRARTLLESGWQRVQDNLTKAEQREFVELLQKSKGRPSNLTAAQKRRLRELVQKAATGS